MRWRLAHSRAARSPWVSDSSISRDWVGTTLMDPSEPFFEDLLLEQLERRMGALDRERQSWFQHWRELSDNILPRRGQFLSFAGQSDRGRKLNGKMLDSTGTLAARTLASGLMSGVTSPARPWFRLTVGDPALAQAPGACACLTPPALPCPPALPTCLPCPAHLPTCLPA